MLRNFFYISSSLLAVNVFGYVFHAVAGRVLGPALYAEYNVLYALMIALSRPVGILTTAATRAAVTARRGGRSFDEVLDFLLRLALFTAIVLGGAPILLSAPISAFLKTGGLVLMVPVGLTLFVWSLSSVYRGLYGSVEAFGFASSVFGFEFFCRALFGIGLVLSGTEVFGALCSSLVGAVIAFAFLLWKRKELKKSYELLRGGERIEGEIGGIAFSVFLIALPAGLFMDLDMLLAKRYFSAEQAGMYAAASVIGKGLLSLSTAASTAVYPRLISEKFSRKGLSAFASGIAITSVLFVSGYAFFRIMGGPVISLLFGSKYAAVVALAPMYVAAMLPLALHMQIANYKGAVGGRAEAVWLWTVLAGYLFCLNLFSKDIATYLSAIFWFHAASAAGSLLFFWLRHRGNVLPAGSGSYDGDRG